MQQHSKTGPAHCRARLQAALDKLHGAGQQADGPAGARAGKELVAYVSSEPAQTVGTPILVFLWGLVRQGGAVTSYLKCLLAVLIAGRVNYRTADLS